MTRGPARDAAYTEFVSARRDYFFRTAFLLTGDAHRAEDLVQIALARLFVAWSRIERRHSLDAYVRRSIVNANIDESRRPWRRERASLADVDESALAAGPGLALEEADELWTALRALPPGQRKVVVLRHYCGLSVEETADDLGISPGTVKSQTAAALTALRTTLAPGPTAPTDRMETFR